MVHEIIWLTLHHNPNPGRRVPEPAPGLVLDLVWPDRFAVEPRGLV